MACQGCSQVGDCACAVIGDGSAITVTGTGGALDPFVVTFDMTTAVQDMTPGTVLSGETWTVVGHRSDGTVRRIPAGAGSCCAKML